MGGFLRQLLAWRRASGRRRSRRPRWRPEVAPLEDRKLLYIPPTKIIVTATPSILSPPRGQWVPVTVSGSILESSTTPARGFFYVTDQYGVVEPRGVLTLHNTPENPYLDTFSFKIYLRAKIGSQTSNGRQYNIAVGGADADGTAAKTIAVLVPKTPVHPKGPTPAPTRSAQAPHARPAHHSH